MYINITFCYKLYINHYTDSMQHHILYTVGPYCEYTDTDESRGLLSACGNRELYNAALGYSCASERDGVRGTFTWTPDSDTPDTVYYQVYI